MAETMSEASSFSTTPRKKRGVHSLHQPHIYLNEHGRRTLGVKRRQQDLESFMQSINPSFKKPRTISIATRRRNIQTPLNAKSPVSSFNLSSMKKVIENTKRLVNGGGVTYSETTYPERSILQPYYERVHKTQAKMHPLSAVQMAAQSRFAPAAGSSAAMNTMHRKLFTLNYVNTSKNSALLSMNASYLQSLTRQVAVANHLQKVKIIADYQHSLPKDPNRNSNHSAGSLIHPEVNSSYITKNYLTHKKCYSRDREIKTFTQVIQNDTFTELNKGAIQVEQLLNTTLGTSFFQVINNWIQPCQVELKAVFTPTILTEGMPPDNSTTTFNSIPMSFRVSLVWDYQPIIGNTALYEEVFKDIQTKDDGSFVENVDQLSGVNIVNIKRFNVIFDVILNVPSFSYSTNPNMNANNNTSCMANANFSIDIDEINRELARTRTLPPLKTNFLATSQIINKDSITSGQLLLLVCPNFSDQINLENNNSIVFPKYTMNIRIYYL